MVTSEIQGRLGITTFLSAVDAWLYFGANEPDPGSRPVQFENIDMRHYLRINDGDLIVFICKGFAATKSHMLIKQDGGLIPLIAAGHFHLPENARDHFTIRFSQRVLSEIQTAHEQPGLRSYPDQLLKMRQWEDDQCRQAALEGVKFMPPTMQWAEESVVSHYAIYDPEILEWCLIPYEQDTHSR